MKEGVLYFMFLIIIMTIAITEQGSNKKTYNDTSTCQSINVYKEVNCIIPQLKFSLKKTYPIVFYAQLLNQKNLVKNRSYRLKSTLFILKWNKLRMLDLKPVIIMPINQKYYNSSKNQDEHHLS
jgi:hypothetical protein